jgi:cell division protein FtsX
MGLKIKIIIAAILFCVISTGYFYIEALQSKLEAAAEVQQRLEGVIDEQKMDWIAMMRLMKKMKELNDAISTQFSDSQSQLTDLRSKFNRINLAEVPSETY